MNVKGKIALVTGAAGGLGKEFSHELLRRGAKVVACDIRKDVGEETVTSFRSQFGESSSLFLYGDVTDQTSMENVFAEAVKHYGGLDIVINNAGIGENAPERTYAINVFGVMRCTELAMKYMKKEGGGRGGTIVNIASTGALLAVPAMHVYCSAKSAVMSYSLGLAAQLGDDHEVQIRVLCPGPVLTDLTANFKKKVDQGDTMARTVVELIGGWNKMTDMVEACMGCIEKKPEPGAVIRVTQEGIFQLFPYQMPKKPFPIK